MHIVFAVTQSFTSSVKIATMTGLRNERQKIRMILILFAQLVKEKVAELDVYFELESNNQ